MDERLGWGGGRAWDRRHGNALGTTHKRIIYVGGERVTSSGLKTFDQMATGGLVAVHWYIYGGYDGGVRYERYIEGCDGMSSCVEEGPLD
jgi:hypothetical protein